jgi:hypothetical protein
MVSKCGKMYSSILDKPYCVLLDMQNFMVVSGTGPNHIFLEGYVPSPPLSAAGHWPELTKESSETLLTTATDFCGLLGICQVMNLPFRSHKIVNKYR